MTGRLLLAVLAVLIMLTLLAMLGGLPRRPTRLPLLPTRLGGASALLAELLVARRLPLAALLTARWCPLGRRAAALPGLLLAGGITRALLAWRSLPGWRLLPSPALVATLLAVLSASVLGAAVLPSHGTRPVGRTPSSD